MLHYMRPHSVSHPKGLYACHALYTQGLGWPFVALLFVPLAVHVVMDQIQIDGAAVKGLTRVVGWGLLSLLLVLPPVLLIDFFYYKRLAFPALR